MLRACPISTPLAVKQPLVTCKSCRHLTSDVRWLPMSELVWALPRASRLSSLCRLKEYEPGWSHTWKRLLQLWTSWSHRQFQMFLHPSGVSSQDTKTALGGGSMLCDIPSGLKSNVDGCVSASLLPAEIAAFGIAGMVSSGLQASQEAVLNPCCLLVSISTRKLCYTQKHGCNHRLKASSRHALDNPASTLYSSTYRQDVLSAGESDLTTVGKLMRFVFLSNFTGHPAISVPVGNNSQGLLCHI